MAPITAGSRVPSLLINSCCLSMNTPDHKQSIDDHASAPTLDYSDDDGRPPTEEERGTIHFAMI
uniref:Uncharacterized protein n=1 Tax=Moniliophthora roreri TaxID=221103 RepID=A0A0W0FUF7_MONRR